LTHAPGATVEWKHAKDGHVHPGGVGPVGNSDYWIGRAVCPSPESKETPGKISVVNKGLFISYGGKEIEYKEYEQLIIRW